MLNASGHLLFPEFLPEHLLGTPSAAPASADASSAESFDLSAFIDARLRNPVGPLHDQVIAAVERLLLTRVLRQTHGHQTQASEVLGVTRATLRHKLRTFGMTVDRVVTEDVPQQDGAGE